MAKKKSRSKKKTVSKGRVRTPRKGGRQVLTTQFIGDFTKEFIRISKKEFIWPTEGQTEQDILDDYRTFVNVLMMVGYLGLASPAAAPGSLGARIGKFLEDQTWPDETPIDEKWVKKVGRPTVHLVEIAVRLDRLLEAINIFSFGKDLASGGGSGWPPHTPGHYPP